MVLEDYVGLLRLDSFIFYQEGADGQKSTLTGDTHNDYLLGKDGDDTLRGNAGDDYIWGGNGNDKIWGNNDDDHLYGEAGDDNIRGGSGDDFIDGGSGIDTIKAGSGDDTIYGGDDNDRIDTANGDETTLEELLTGLNLRIVTGDVAFEGFDSGNDNPDDLNTGIYYTHGTIGTTDDLLIMVLEDFSDLTISHFDIF